MSLQWCLNVVANKTKFSCLFSYLSMRFNFGQFQPSIVFYDSCQLWVNLVMLVARLLLWFCIVLCWTNHFIYFTLQSSVTITLLCPTCFRLGFHWIVSISISAEDLYLDVPKIEKNTINNRSFARFLKTCW